MGKVKSTLCIVLIVSKLTENVCVIIFFLLIRGSTKYNFVNDELIFCAKNQIKNSVPFVRFLFGFEVK